MKNTKKRNLVSFVATRMVAMCVLLCKLYIANAADITYNDLEYTILSDSTVSLTGPKKTTLTQLIVPDYVEYNGKKYYVVSVGKNAYYNNDKIKTVDFSACTKLAIIDTLAFSSAENLKTVVFPTSLEKINFSGFKGTGILTIDLSNCRKLKNIGVAAFLKFTTKSNNEVYLPSSVEEIGANAFNSSQTTDCKCYLSMTNIPSFENSKPFPVKSTLYVPIAQKNAYQEVENLSLYKSKMTGWIPDVSTQAYIPINGEDNEYWGTIYVPKNVSVPDDVKVYAVTQAPLDGIITIKEVNIPSGYCLGEGGYLLSSSTTMTKLMFIEDSVNTAVTVEDNILKGTTTNVIDQTPDGEDKKYYVLADGAEGTAFYYTCEDGNTVTNRAYKAYLALPEQQNKTMSLKMMIDRATSINEIKTESRIRNDNIYNLQGLQMKEETINGIYIQGGKKYVTVSR